jgi:sulfatase maturation enzyme AslB (radical SAM superfamily)
VAKESGIVNIGVSFDGLRETHDFIRMSGSFERSLAALALMRDSDMPTVACTTVNKRNIKKPLKNSQMDRGSS